MRKRPDYGNATPEDLARALLRPRKPKPENPVDAQKEQPPGLREERVKYQRKK